MIANLFRAMSDNWNEIRTLASAPDIVQPNFQHLGNYFTSICDGKYCCAAVLIACLS